MNKHAFREMMTDQAKRSEDDMWRRLKHRGYDSRLEMPEDKLVVSLFFCND